MSKKRYMEILTEEINKTKGIKGSVLDDVEYNTAVRFAHEYHYISTGTTKIITEGDGWYKVDLVECCKVGPIGDEENYCSNCGKKIKRS